MSIVGLQQTIPWEAPHGAKEQFHTASARGVKDVLGIVADSPALHWKTIQKLSDVCHSCYRFDSIYTQLICKGAHMCVILHTNKYVGMLCRQTGVAGTVSPPHRKRDN